MLFAYYNFFSTYIFLKFTYLTDLKILRYFILNDAISHIVAH